MGACLSTATPQGSNAIGSAWHIGKRSYGYGKKYFFLVSSRAAWEEANAEFQKTKISYQKKKKKQA